MDFSLEVPVNPLDICSYCLSISVFCGCEIVCPRGVHVIRFNSPFKMRYLYTEDEISTSYYCQMTSRRVSNEYIEPDLYSTKSI